jgi:hypothetical protein
VAGRREEVERHEPQAARQFERRAVVGKCPDDLVGEESATLAVELAAAGVEGELLAVDTAFEQDFRQLPGIANAEIEALAGNRVQGLRAVADPDFAALDQRLTYAQRQGKAALELELIDHGLQELGEGSGEKGEKQIILRCNFSDFGQLQTALEAKGIHPVSSESEYIPTTTVTLDEEKAKEVLELVDRFEQDDDVQRVFHNLV